MVLTAEVRKQKLAELKNNPQAKQGSQKLYYKNETKYFDIFRIDIDYLIYNRHNGRLEAEMLTWQKEHALNPDEYSDELHSLIDEFLWKSSESRNVQTLADLKDKGQQRCGIVTLDGVIIDGNRRAMLLRRLAEKGKKEQQFFDAIILPDAYAENQKEIVRLETQYQLGEDSKVEYGPLQKYLHARRLCNDLNIPPEEVDILMGEAGSKNGAFTKRLLEILSLMDDYLEHIGCPGLYTMLKDRDGTKEGMFVDLYGDLKRLQSGSAKVPWTFEPTIDPLQLRLIQFDYMRLGDFADAKKTYREISHQSNGKNFFAYKDIWENFRDSHQNSVDPITTGMGSLEDFIDANPGYESKVDAARARDNTWKEKVKGPMLGNFGKSSYALDLRVNELKPKEYLERAMSSLEKIDIDGESLLSDPENKVLIMEINKLTYEMKKKFERNGQ
jgi:hypothetical protein